MYVRYDRSEESFQRFIDLSNRAGARMSPDQLVAFSYYSGDGYKQITHELYAGACSPKTARILAEIDKAFERNHLPENVLLFRGQHLSRKYLRGGAEFTDLGYISTSVKRSEALRWAMLADDGDDEHPAVLLTIQADAGQPAIFMGGCSVNPFECEILLPRFTRFVVKHVAENEFGHIFVTVRICR